MAQFASGRTFGVIVRWADRTKQLTHSTLRGFEGLNRCPKICDERATIEFDFHAEYSFQIDGSTSCAQPVLFRENHERFLILARDYRIVLQELRIASLHALTGNNFHIFVGVTEGVGRGWFWKSRSVGRQGGEWLKLEPQWLWIRKARNRFLEAVDGGVAEYHLSALICFRAAQPQLGWRRAEQAPSHLGYLYHNTSKTLNLHINIAE